MIYDNRNLDPLETKAKKTTGRVFSPEKIDTSILQTIPYKYPYRKINVELTTEEFTCVCPFSGLPDFACLSIKYVPRKRLIELKSLKYYLYAYRNVAIYNEHVVNKIVEDLKQVLNPHQLTVEGTFTVRGGVKNTVTASYKAKQ